MRRVAPNAEIESDGASKMRRTFALVAAGLLLSVLAAAPAGAAGGTTCKTGGGTVTFTPPLPDATSAKKVKSAQKRNGTVAGCSGTVKSGKITGVSPKGAGANCVTLQTWTSKPTKIALTVKWNTGKSSTIAAQLKEIANVSVTTQTVSGSVTAGLFKGSKLSGKFTYTLPKDGCSKGHPLARVTYKDIGALTIK
jgi:hypothetical protein